MRLLSVLFLLCAAGAADTLDFGRGLIVVTMTDNGSALAVGGSGVSERAVAVLGMAPYDRTWSVATWLAAHPSSQRRLQHLTFSGNQSAPRYLSDGTVTVDHEFELAGSVLKLLMPPTGYGELQGRQACPTCGQAWPEGRDAPPGTRLVPAAGDGTRYTGILIDATGLGLRPALFPRVVTEEDKEVFGSGFSDPDHIAASGLVSYFTDRSIAYLSDRTGSDPLVVRALAVAGANGCDVVVSRYDAARIHGSKANLDLLLQCRVGILTDKSD